MSVDQDHLQRVRRLLWTLLVFATSASLAGNITHAVGRHAGMSTVGPILAAALAPMALLGLTHLFGMWSRVSARGMTYWVFLAAITLLGAAAFRLSFDALRSLAVTYGYGRFDAALFPLILDGLISICTLGLVTLTRVTAQHDAADAAAPAAVTRRDAPDASPLRHVDVPAGAAAPLEDAPTVTQRQRVEPAPALSVLDDAPAPQREPDDAPAASDTHVASPGGDTVIALEHPRLGSDADATPMVEPDEHAEVARRLVDSGRTSADPETVIRVLRRAAAGTSSRIIADEVGVSPSSVQRLVKAAREESVPASS